MTNPFERTGRNACECIRAFAGYMEVLGETFCEAVGMLFHPRRFRFGDFLLAFERASFDGLTVTIGIGFLLGLILAFESAAYLRLFGAETFVANLLALAIFRELGPIITAVVLAGRSGSAFAAEIGTMKVNEELDALTTMGLPPVRFLVMPRVAAAVLAMPVLVIFADLAAMVGGAIVMKVMEVPSSVYWNNVSSVSDWFMISLGLVKGALFGLFVAVIGCSAGMRTSSTADGVGTAATTSVVGSIIAIAVTDGVLAVLCYVWNI